MLIFVSIILLVLVLLVNNALCDIELNNNNNNNFISSSSVDIVDNSVDLLEALAFKYGTDKSKDDHKYVDVYESLFQSKRRHIKNITEIGVSAGQSLQMWDDYFIGTVSIIIIIVIIILIINFQTLKYMAWILI